MKRKFAQITALIAATAVLSVTVSAVLYDVNDDKIVNINDAYVLSAGLLGREKLSDSGDVDGNGSTDCSDLAMLKRFMLTQEQGGDPITADYYATSENVKLVGRTLTSNNVTWLVQSGSAAEFTVTGTEASVTLAGDGCVYSDEKYRPRYAVYLDGELLTDALLSKTELVVPLFSGSTQRTSTVKVIHLSEANNGAIGVRKLSVTSSAAKPVRPTEKKKLQIEFIGDSITCAYGVEGKDQYESFSTATENFTKSYAYLTAQQLDADYSAVSYSGHGIISGYTSGPINTDSLVPDCYNLVGKLADYAKPWNFTDNENDVVVINLGTNDSSYLSKDMEGRSADFVNGYADFLGDVRSLNPDSYIICTVGTMGCEDVYPLIEQAIVKYKSGNNDLKISSYLSTVQDQANGLGADWHPSEKTQQLSAYVLADKICQVLGMPSDRIGLDAAADAKYSMVLNKEIGANASDYFGYGKTYWINIVEGGEKPEDIKGIIDGISLIPGEYKLEFEITTAGALSVPYALQHKGGSGAEYCSGTIDGPVESEHITHTFRVSESDDECELAFLLGGVDRFSTTISNVSLFKLA